MAKRTRSGSSVDRNSVDWREVHQMIDGAVMRIDRSITDLRGRIEERDKKVEERLDSLEQTRAENKGRAVVVAFIVSALVSFASAVLLFILTSSSRNQPPPEATVPTPNVTVIVTSSPAAFTGQPPGTTPVVDRNAGRASTPGPSPTSPQPSPTSTPTESPAPIPRIIAVACDTLPPGLERQLCGPPPRGNRSGLGLVEVLLLPGLGMVRLAIRKL